MNSFLLEPALTCAHVSLSFLILDADWVLCTLRNWAAGYFGTSPQEATFQHEFYEHVFELLLRLKANMFWPAMWAGKFAIDDPTNLETANAYGVVYSTSHQEPMGRSSPNEVRADCQLGLARTVLELIHRLPNRASSSRS